MTTALGLIRILAYLATMYFVGTAMTMVVTSRPANPEMLDPRLKLFGNNRTRYLTGWNVALMVAHAVLGLCCELLLIKNTKTKGYRLPKHLKGARDRLFTNIVFPGSLLVATLFWSIWAYDRELVFPRFLDDVVSNYTNHVIHTAIVPVVLFEVLVQPRYKPRSHMYNILHIFLHCALYAFVVFYTYYETGHWLYPILISLHKYPPLFVLFAIITVGMAYLFYFVHWRMAWMVWGDRPVAAPVGKTGKTKKVR